jgi:predicted PurR-regulated permease PerM
MSIPLETPPPASPSRPVVTLSTRTIVRVFFTIAALAVLLDLIYQVRSVLLLVFIALFLAVALGPAVDALVRRHLPRALAILLVYLGIMGAIVGVGLLIVPPVVTQVEQLSTDIPGYVADLRQNKTFRDYDNRYQLSAKLNKQAATLPSRLGDAAGALSSVTVGVFSVLVQLITVLTMTFFLLLDGGRVMDFVLRVRGTQAEGRLRRLAEDIYRSTAGYVAGNLVISVIAGLTTFIALSILGVPFAVPLAVLMAFLDLIPLVGASIAGLIIGIVTAFTDFPTATIVWAVVFIVYQQVENNVLQPLVYKRTVSVSPLLVIVSILIGSSLLGVLGALVAIPVAAAIQIVLKDLWNDGTITPGPATSPEGASVVLPPGAELPARPEPAG